MQAFFQGLEGLSFLDLFLYAAPSTKLVSFVLIIFAVVALIFAFVQHNEKSEKSGLLSVLAILGPVVGILAALYVAVIVYIVATKTNTTDIRILAPSILEVIWLISLSLLVWLIAFVGNVGTKSARH